MKALGDYWHSYDAVLREAGASEAQRIVCRRVFYSGALAMFELTAAAGTATSYETFEATLNALEAETLAIVLDAGSRVQ